MQRCLIVILSLIASGLSAQEAQVTETRTEATPELYESITGFDGQGNVVALTTVRVATTVMYNRISGDPLTDADADQLDATAMVCDGPEILNISRRVTADAIVFTYDCIRAE